MAPEPEEFTYASLVNRLRRERGAALLTKMDGRFYEAFDAHLRELRDEYQREHAVNPATPKVLILQDELMKLQQVREDIYDLRERKVATAALIAARGGKQERSNMTKEEDVLFEELTRVFRESRRSLLRRAQPIEPPAAGAKLPPGPPTPLEPIAAPMASAAQPAATAAARADASPESPLPGAPIAPPPKEAPRAEAVAASEDAPARRSTSGRVLVRLKEAVPAFVGPDLRQYRLAAEDVAAVPREVGQALIQRGVAVALSG